MGESTSGNMEWVQVGWMVGASLAAELEITPLDEDWLLSVEVCEAVGGMNPEAEGRMVPVYARQSDIDAQQTGRGDGSYEPPIHHGVTMALTVDQRTVIANE